MLQDTFVFLLKFIVYNNLTGRCLSEPLSEHHKPLAKYEYWKEKIGTRFIPKALS